MSASAKRNSLLRCLIIKKTAEHMMSITISVEPASHTHAHNREIIVTCCAALGAVAARHMRHLSLCGWCSCRDTPSAALLRRCCRASRANMDQPRTPPTYGRHRKRMARPVANVQRAHSLRPRGSSLRSSLFQGARASTSDGLFSLTGADPLVDFTVSHFHIHFHFHFHFPAKKSAQKGEVGSDPRAGSVPPRSPLHYQLENGGAITFPLFQCFGVLVFPRPPA